MDEDQEKKSKDEEELEKELEEELEKELKDSLENLDENEILKKLEDSIDPSTIYEARKHSPVVVGPSDGIFPKIWQNILYLFALTSLTLLAADGFIQAYVNTPIYYILLQVYIFVIIEYFIRRLIKTKFLMTYMLSFSSIMLPFSLGLFIGLFYLFRLFLPIEARIGRLFIVFFLMDFVRMLVNLYLTKRIISRRFFRDRGGRL